MIGFFAELRNAMLMLCCKGGGGGDGGGERGEGVWGHEEPFYFG